MALPRPSRAKIDSDMFQRTEGLMASEEIRATALPHPQRVCIMGCGRVGARLADNFHSVGARVTIIDLSSDAFDRLMSKEVRDAAVLGDGTDPDVLKKAGIEEAVIFIAVTNGDNRNIMASQIAKVTFEVPNVLCRIYDPRRHEIYRKLGVNSYCPTLNAAQYIFEAMSGALLPATSNSNINNQGAL